MKQAKPKNKKPFLLLTAVVIIAIISLNFYEIRSYLVMSIYSRYNFGLSVMKEQEFKIKVKGGAYTYEKDWYPLVNTYDTSYEFARYMGQDLSLTVLYNFGAFNGNSSSFYDENSEYFASFYGAYVVRDNENPDNHFGFADDDKTLDADAISKVAGFDYKYLVIEDLGCDSPVFEVVDYNIVSDVDYIGYSDWTRIDAEIIANSPSHEKVEKKLGYIQYGMPLDNGKEDFFKVKLYGRMYARYFKEYSTTIVVYVMGANQNTIDNCDLEILSKTVIEPK